MTTPIIQGLHHFAYRCRDAEETRVFYEDLLGLPLCHYIESDYVPSTGEYCPYVHIFFRLADGSCVAFFDLGDNQVALPSPNTPAWVNHLALSVPSLNDLLTIKQKLQQAGIEVIGPTDHKIFQSIYFFDPNGIRLELTAQQAGQPELDRLEQEAHNRLNDWNRRKQKISAYKPSFSQ
jgi:catechol 2,3-dioxygenase-like lactoylglutathione lyase family enzyme